MSSYVSGGGRPSIGNERDKTGDERDQAGDQRDQAADQRDLAGEDRDRVADQRDRSADQRDRAGEDRDRAGDSRDRAADLRERADRQVATSGKLDPPADPDSLAANDRRQAAHDRKRALQDRAAGADERAHAEADRSDALTDRSEGVGARSHAKSDRQEALADRGASAMDRAAASLDALTRVYSRGAGAVEVERDMARAKRTKQPLVLAFVDVDHLKGVNDTRGHAAGDRMLLDVANALSAILRPYDLVVRYGGDEFICACTGLKLADTVKRLATVNTVLAAAPEAGSVTVGIAEMRTGDTLQNLVARADRALYLERQTREPRRA